MTDYDEARAFSALEARFNNLAASERELRLSVPMLYLGS